MAQHREPAAPNAPGTEPCEDDEDPDRRRAHAQHLPARDEEQCDPGCNGPREVDDDHEQVRRGDRDRETHRNTAGGHEPPRDEREERDEREDQEDRELGSRATGRHLERNGLKLDVAHASTAAPARPVRSASTAS